MDMPRINVEKIKDLGALHAFKQYSHLVAISDAVLSNVFLPLCRKKRKCKRVSGMQGQRPPVIVPTIALALPTRH